ncbi:hypothetical protein AB0L17_37615, partial [Streptomyces cellulosae]
MIVGIILAVIGVLFVGALVSLARRGGSGRSVGTARRGAWASTGSRHDSGSSWWAGGGDSGSSGGGHHG